MRMKFPYFPAWFTAWICHMACESLPVQEIVSLQEISGMGNCSEARDPNYFGSRLQPAVPSPLTSRHDAQIHAFQRVSRLWGCFEHGGWWRGAWRPSTGAFVESLGDHWGGVRDREVQTWETWGMKWELLAAAWGTERWDNCTIYIYIYISISISIYIYIIYICIYIHHIDIQIYIWLYIYIYNINNYE